MGCACSTRRNTSQRWLGPAYRSLPAALLACGHARLELWREENRTAFECWLENFPPVPCPHKLQTILDDAEPFQRPDASPRNDRATQSFSFPGRCKGTAPVQCHL